MRRCSASRASVGFWTHRLPRARRGPGDQRPALRRDGDRPSATPTPCKSPWWRCRGSRANPAGATAEIPARPCDPRHPWRHADAGRRHADRGDPVRRARPGGNRQRRHDAVERYQAPGTAVGGIVDLRSARRLPARRGRGAGRCITWRSARRMTQEQAAMVGSGWPTTTASAPPSSYDRNYFRSVYFPRAGPCVVRDRDR